VFANSGSIAAQVVGDGGGGGDALLRPGFNLAEFIGCESFSTGHVDSMMASFGMSSACSGRVGGDQRGQTVQNDTLFCKQNRFWQIF